jgi:hypothetical protein
MIFRIGIENNNDDRSIAWALDHPGCFAYGQNSQEAQRNFLQAAHEYIAWIARHEDPWLDNDVEVLVEETFEPYFVNSSFERVRRGKGTYMVESFFLNEWKPLLPDEIERALKLLAWSRADLLDLVKGLSPEKLAETYPNERGRSMEFLTISVGQNSGIRRELVILFLKMERMSLKTHSSGWLLSGTIPPLCFPSWKA